MTTFTRDEISQYPSWDYLVETGEFSPEVSEKIISLGLYALPINEMTLKAFNENVVFVPPKYSIQVSASDGMEMYIFETAEGLAKYIRGWSGAYLRGKKTFSEDGTSVTLLGEIDFTDLPGVAIGNDEGYKYITRA